MHIATQAHSIIHKENCMNSSHKLLLALALTASLAACKKDEPAPAPEVSATPPVAAAAPMPVQAPSTVTVAKIDLGSAVGTDMKVAAPSTTFKPTDTIYAAIATTGTASSAELKATWSYQDGSVVNEDTTYLKDLAGPNVTDFQIAKPDGWPLGKYKVEISLNGSAAGSADFTVAK
jgi:hypothetical protein